MSSPPLSQRRIQGNPHCYQRRYPWPFALGNARYGSDQVGDVDPRDNTACHHVSDKAFAIGGGILEAILGRFNRPCYIRRGILHCPVDKNVPTA